MTSLPYVPYVSSVSCVTFLTSLTSVPSCPLGLLRCVRCMRCVGWKHRLSCNGLYQQLTDKRDRCLADGSASGTTQSGKAVTSSHSVTRSRLKNEMSHGWWWVVSHRDESQRMGWVTLSIWLISWASWRHCASHVMSRTPALSTKHSYVTHDIAYHHHHQFS